MDLQDSEINGSSLLTKPWDKKKWRDRLSEKLRIKNRFIRQVLGEFFATLFLVVFSQSLVASVIFAGKKKDILLIGFGQGLGVTFAVYLGRETSGAVLNPAICLANAVVGRLPWRTTICYIIAQYIAALCASVLVYAIHYESLNNYDGGVRAAYGPNGTAGIFAPAPSAHRSTGGAFFHTVTSACFLMIGIRAIADERNWQPKHGLFPFAIGFFITLVVLAFGYGESLSMNPAIDFAGRLCTVLVGYGTDSFSHWNYGFFWIPIVGSHFGAVVGALLYSGAISMHRPPAHVVASKSAGNGWRK